MRAPSEKCCAQLRSLRWPVQCSHRAVVHRAGFGFCRTHDPGESLEADAVAGLAMPKEIEKVQSLTDFRYDE